MITFAQKYAKLNQDYLPIILIAGFYIAYMLVAGRARGKRKQASTQSMPRRAKAARPTAPPLPGIVPGPAVEVPKPPTPFLSGNDGIGSGIDLSGQKSSDEAITPQPPKRRRRPALPDGTDPRAALLWGEVLRRRF